jgi:uncharacterized membrane protein SpoIIM required for sporulation
MSDLIENIVSSFSVLNFNLILLSAILFTLGLVLADLVLERNIRWLIIYPTWAFEKIEQWMKMFSNVILTFLFIFVFNTVNLFLGFVSGLLIILPIILTVWTGLNIGIILKKTMGDHDVSIWFIFLNPVAIFELPAAWISFSIGIELMIKYISTQNYAEVITLFSDRITVFLWLVVPLLLIAGLIEAAMIHFLQNKVDKDDSSDK